MPDKTIIHGIRLSHNIKIVQIRLKITLLKPLNFIYTAGTNGVLHACMHNIIHLQQILRYCDV